MIDSEREGLAQGTNAIARRAVVLATGSFATLSLVDAAWGQHGAGHDVRAIAKEAYIYGVPLIDQYRVMYAFSIDKGNPQYKGPFNTILNIGRVFTPEDTAFVTPNSDTPYSFAVLDLRAEPVVITVPKIDSRRYFVFQLMDLYTFNFAYIGTRATGNNGGHFMIVGPGWKGDKPNAFAKVIHAETQLVSVVGRTQLFNPTDLDHVKKIQAGYRVRTQSQFFESPAPRAPQTVPWPKPLPPGADRTSLEFFNQLAFLLQFGMPPHKSEDQLRKRFASIGIVPGKPIDVAKLPPAAAAAMKAGMADGQREIDARRAAVGGKTDTLFGTRDYLKNDFVARATGTQIGIGANSRQEAMYPIYDKDADGKPLDGNNRYTLRFAKGELPPVNGFWSLTMYDLPKQLLVKNPIDRYLINSPMLPQLKRDPDGGLTIYVQSDPPGKDKQANWLPAPKGAFMAAMRYYLPKPELLEGRWTTPAMQRVP